MTIVHRFNSPSWMATLKGHLAGVSYQGNGSSERNTDEIFNTIVSLDAGQALIFSPSAMLDVSELTMNSSNEVATVKKLGLGYVKIRVRQRLTTDGGRSLMAASAA